MSKCASRYLRLSLNCTVVRVVFISAHLPIFFIVEKKTNYQRGDSLKYFEVSKPAYFRPYIRFIVVNK